MRPINNDFPALDLRGIGMKIGDLATYYHRLVTITKVDQLGHPTEVKFIDEGGIAHTLNITGFVRPQKLDLSDKDQTLDLLMATTRPDLNFKQRRDRIAEIWFADPKVGDRFGDNWGSVLQIKEIHPDGRIEVEYSRNKTRFVRTIYQNAADLRNAFTAPLTKPGYSLWAFWSERTPPLYLPGDERRYNRDNLNENIARYGRTAPTDNRI